VLTSLDGAAVRAWCAAAVASLRRHEQEIDELNVYPVPDGDTGRNLVLTLTSAWEMLLANGRAGSSEDVANVGSALRCMARGALLGARGNSGVIVAQLLRGASEGFGSTREAGGRGLAAALERAADAAYAAVVEPVEGTVLSVARAAAEAARGSDSDDLAAVSAAALEGAAAALARTPFQLAALARAGVVDAGGRGLVVILEALHGVVTGNIVVAGSVTGTVVAGAESVGRADAGRRAKELQDGTESGALAPAYEVQFLLEASAAAVDRMTATLARLGDSLVVVGAEADGWNVHVHVDDVGAAIEAGVEAGRPHRISVTRFSDQVSERPTGSASRAVVAITCGEGLSALFTREGATVLTGGHGRSPSTAEVLAAIQHTRATNVVVLPNDPDIVAIAHAAAEEARASGVTVAVVPSRSAVQGIAALAVRDPGRRFPEEVIAMAEASGATRWAELAVASREALTSAGRCQAGDVLAMVEREVVLVARGPSTSSLAHAAVDLLDRMLAGGGELATLITGAEAPPGLAEEVHAHLRRRWPLVEVVTIDGGMPHPPVLVGIE
jgi:DAK2 domain fusion protein YloV